MENIFKPKSSDLGDAAKELLAEQIIEWDLLASGNKSLKSIKVKKFEFEGFDIKVQFNPGRMVSTAAKVDPKSIKERKCFLCPQNLPPAQKGILYQEKYIVLCNPFPIFPEHFTIPGLEHKPQVIKGAFPALLDISKDLSKYYTVFYNGPKCGASAPDHFHFQAGDKNFMPIDGEYENLKSKFGQTVYAGGDITITAIDDTLRKMISFESADKAALAAALDKFYDKYKEIAAVEAEPMLNILAFYGEKGWRILFLLREKHRPSHYFREGEDQILLSPASVDLGGVCITPLEKDFNKITKENLIEIFSEVFISREKLDEIKKETAKLF